MRMVSYHQCKPSLVKVRSTSCLAFNATFASTKITPTDSKISHACLFFISDAADISATLPDTSSHNTNGGYATQTNIVPNFEIHLIHSAVYSNVFLYSIESSPFRYKALYLKVIIKIFVNIAFKHVQCFIKTIPLM